MAPGYELRAAEARDVEFAWRLYEQLMRARTEALMPWRADRQREVVESALRSGGMQMIVAGGSVCGWLHVLDGTGTVELHQLYLAPVQQRRGIGTSILRALQSEAAAAGRPLCLNVLINNPARRLYERLGFRIERTDPIKHYMAWRAPGAGAAP
jgi:ribosomal protein S18 acetylase RimI-like enzyme